MSFRLIPKSVTLNDFERRNSQPPRNFTEFGRFRDGHDIEVFMYVLRSSQCSCLHFVVRIDLRRRREKFTFAISSADEFLVCIFSVLWSRRQSATSTRDLTFAIRHLRSLR